MACVVGSCAIVLWFRDFGFWVLVCWAYESGSCGMLVFSFCADFLFVRFVATAVGVCSGVDSLRCF